MLRRVLKYIRDNALLNPHDKVLVCVSGGADSVALLDVLCRGGYECVVAHCNFHLRGEESDRDETFVRSLCSERGVRLFVNHFDTFLYAREHNASIELSARELRYTWFEKLARQENCAAIAVAHHQNDQAETVIMNLRRGAGVKGLCGIWPSRAIGQPDYVRSNSSPSKTDAPCVAPNPTVPSAGTPLFLRDSIGAPIAQSAGCPTDLRVIRPLLCTTHDYICHYLKDIRHIDWVEDSSNGDTKYRRNAIREELKSYSKAEIEHIAKTAEIMQQFVRDNTRHYGLIGKPLEHSFSKQWFTEFFEREHVLADYSEITGQPDGVRSNSSPSKTDAPCVAPNPTVPSAGTPLFLRDSIGAPIAQSAGCPIKECSKLDGYNVTYPYKEEIMSYLDEVDSIAQKIGAVNVVKGKKGYNTDWIGFTKAIKPYLKKEDKKALILGTGGAAKAVNYALHKLGIKTQYVSRDADKGLPYAALTEEIMHEYTIIVNCTPLGMYPNVEACPDIPYQFISSAHILFDCIYNPAVTLFMQRGQEQGARVVNGRKMLEEQAKAAWDIWRL